MGKFPTTSGLSPARAIITSSTTTSSTLSTAPTRSRVPASLTCQTATNAHGLRSHQLRHATFIPRPRRPYTFTQLVQLSDGSAYTVRTTSPQPLYRSTKDARNTLLWQPSERSLKNVELDEAGRLAAFRERFGRGFDASSLGEEGAEEGGVGESDGAAASDDSFADLITGYSPQDAATMRSASDKKASRKK